MNAFSICRFFPNASYIVFLLTMCLLPIFNPPRVLVYANVSKVRTSSILNSVRYFRVFLHVRYKFVFFFTQMYSTGSGRICLLLTNAVEKVIKLITPRNIPLQKYVHKMSHRMPRSKRNRVGMIFISFPF